MRKWDRERHEMIRISMEKLQRLQYARLPSGISSDKREKFDITFNREGGK